MEIKVNEDSSTLRSSAALLAKATPLWRHEWVVPFHQVTWRTGPPLRDHPNVTEWVALPRADFDALIASLESALSGGARPGVRNSLDRRDDPAADSLSPAAAPGSASVDERAAFDRFCIESNGFSRVEWMLDGGRSIPTAIGPTDIPTPVRNEWMAFKAGRKSALPAVDYHGTQPVTVEESALAHAEHEECQRAIRELGAAREYLGKGDEPRFLERFQRAQRAESDLRTAIDALTQGALRRARVAPLYAPPVGAAKPGDDAVLAERERCAEVCKARARRHNDNASEKADDEHARDISGRRASEATACAREILEGDAS